MKRDFHIVIAGAGPVGLTLAALLSPLRERRRLRLTVVDGSAAPAFSFENDIDLRVSAISAGSQQVLAAAGAWQRVAPDRICRYADMCVWDASTAVESPETLHFSAAEHALPELGHIVENSLLQHALLSSLYGQGQQVSFDCEIG